MPRKTRTARSGGPLLRPLRRLEEDGELVERIRPERLERRHRRARVHARRALEVAHLEVDTEVLRADVRQVGRAQVRRAGAEVGMARRAAGLGEQVCALDRLRVAGEALLLRPARDCALDLAGE